VEPPRALDQRSAVAGELSLALGQCRGFRHRRAEAAERAPGDRQRGEQQSQRGGEERRGERERQQVLAAPEPGEREIEHHRHVGLVEHSVDDGIGEPGSREVGEAVVVHEVGLDDDDDGPQRGVGLLGRIVSRSRVELRIVAGIVEIAREHRTVLVGDQRQQRDRV